MRHLRFPMLFLFLLPFLQPQADDDFDRLREQFVTLTVSGCSAADDNAARQILERQRADGTFTDDDVTALRAQFGEQNVQTGGMLEFEVKDGKATVNDTELTFTSVPDGIVRV